MFLHLGLIFIEPKIAFFSTETINIYLEFTPGNSNSKSILLNQKFKRNTPLN